MREGFLPTGHPIPLILLKALMRLKNQEDSFDVCWCLNHYYSKDGIYNLPFGLALV